MILKHSYLIISSFVLLLQGCGTIGSRRSIVAVDSSPRGALVYETGESVALGTTPFFLEKDKKFHQSFLFKLGEREEEVGSFCSLNWSESVLPNLVPSFFFPIGTIFSGGFLLTDWASGSIYRCKRPIVADFGDSNASLIPPKKILVIPPPLKDHLKAKSLAEKVLEQLGLKKHAISWDKSEEVLEYFGIDQSRGIELSSIPDEHWREIGHRTQADHLLYFKSGKGQFTPVLVDMLNHQQTEMTPADYTEDKSFSDYLASTFSFFPNALTLSQMLSISVTNIDDPNNEHTKQHPSRLPFLISLWGMENVSNPRLLTPWDYELNFSPIIAFPAFRFQYDDYWINGQRFTLAYQAALTLHSPFGAIRLSYALGPAYSSYEDSEGKTGGQWQAFARQISASYYAFFTERLYFKISATNYRFSSEEYQGKAKGLAVAYFTLGYYIPHLKWKLRQLFPF